MKYINNPNIIEAIKLAAKPIHSFERIEMSEQTDEFIKTFMSFNNWQDNVTDYFESQEQLDLLPDVEFPTYVKERNICHTCSHKCKSKLPIEACSCYKLAY